MIETKQVQHVGVAVVRPGILSVRFFHGLHSRDQTVIELSFEQFSRMESQAHKAVRSHILGEDEPTGKP